ncbi:MAG: putative vancomycin resistance protein-like protein [Frankiales bacterium]|nr:putative vancomycin resistance protein-like protein [Frankiales bacterium]
MAHGPQHPSTRTLPVSRRLRVAVVGASLATVGLGVGLAATNASADATAPGTRIGGLPVGGLQREAVEALLRRTVAGSPERLTVAAGTRRGAVATADLGLTLDVAATADKVLADSGAGRRLLVLGQRRGRDVAPVLHRDDRVLAQAVVRLQQTTEVPESHGALRYANGTVTAVPPADGQQVEDSALRAALLRNALRLPRPATVTVPVTVRPAHVLPTEVEVLAGQARTLLAQPLTLRAGTRTTTVLARTLGPQLVVRGQGEGPGHGVALGLAGTARERVAVPAAAALSVAAQEPVVDAPAPTPVLRAQGNVTWRPTAAAVRLVTPARPGQTVTADDVLAALDGAVVGSAAGPPTGALPVPSRPQQPRSSDAGVQSIDAVLGTFTTPYACCQPRVQNIALMARTLDGTLIGPGQTFSLNGLVGRRTRAKGYVEAPFILDGELSTDVGGGVSQFATTTLNAAFFAGLRLDRHQAHSFYISRYPAGREATVNYPTIDLSWTNDTSAPVLVRAAALAKSLTVTLYGHDDGRTVTGTSGPRQAVPGKDFRIKISRTVAVPGAPARHDSFTTTYRKPPADH